MLVRYYNNMCRWTYPGWKLLLLGGLALAGVLGAALGLALTLPRDARAPHGYPLRYGATIASAEREGKLVIYSVTEERKAARLIADFRRLYPKIALTYVTLSAVALYDRVIRESDQAGSTADIAWSSAMDLQIKLVNDGYAQAYDSPERFALPKWASWKNEAWGVTAEPIVIAYNARAVPKADIPATHEEFSALLRRRRDYYRGRVAAYDPLRSASGYLYLTQDEQATQDSASLLRAMIKADVALYDSTEEVLRDVARGRMLFAYNVVGSYAMERRARDGSVGIVMPADYTLVMSRIALIPARAAHAEAARLFLDFLLSRRGQTHLAAMHMNAVRMDLTPQTGLSPPVDQARTIRVGPALLFSLDTLKKERFSREWNDLRQQRNPAAAASET